MRSVALALSGLVGVMGGCGGLASAQVAPSQASCQSPPPAATAATVSSERPPQSGLAVPSLWWAQAQFDPDGGRLTSRWVAYPQHQRIDLIVSRQRWRGLDYLDRYRTLHQFGTVARAYGYDLQVLDGERSCLATYRCQFQRSPPRCRVAFGSLLQPYLQTAPASR